MLLPFARVVREQSKWLLRAILRHQFRGTPRKKDIRVDSNSRGAVRVSNNGRMPRNAPFT